MFTVLMQRRHIEGEGQFPLNSLTQDVTNLVIQVSPLSIITDKRLAMGMRYVMESRMFEYRREWELEDEVEVEDLP